MAMKALSRDKQPRRLTRHRLLSAVCATIVLAVSACDSLTSVHAPDVVQPSDLNSRVGAQSLRAGALKEFVDAFSGGGHEYVVYSGLIADEFTSSGLTELVDQRRVDDPSRDSRIYADLQAARVSLVQAIAAMTRYDSEARSSIAELQVLAAYAETFLGESFCSGIPLSTIDDQRPVFGAPLTNVQLYEHALVRLDSAAALATADSIMRNLVRVARGRVLLNLGRFADASAAVSGVPTDFSYATENNATIHPNGVFETTYQDRLVSVANLEGSNGTGFISENDARVVTELIGPGNYDHVTPVYGAAKYAAAASRVVLTSVIEGRLIEAENLLQRGDAQGALD